jgi:single-stranded DNA-binding protein
MSTRTITGRLAADPVVQKAGRMDITKFTVMENTGRYRAGEWVADDAATPHHVEAKFELGAAAAGLHKGDLVIVVGYERTNTWTKDGAAQYKRVIEADQIGTSITNGRNGTRNTTEEAPDAASNAAGWEVAPVGQAANPDAPSSGFVGYGDDIAALLEEARLDLAEAQAGGDELAIKKAMRAVVDLEKAEENRMLP